MASGVSGLRGRYLVRAFRVRGPHAAVRRGQTGGGPTQLSAGALPTASDSLLPLGWGSSDTPGP